MKSMTAAMMAWLALAPAHAGEGRVLFVCEAGTATCELAAQRFETRSRANGWHLAGRAATIDTLAEADLALAMKVITINAPLYRRWLLSIKELEAWDEVPPLETDPEGCRAAIEKRLDALHR